jgi:signal peptide peptidase SppA
MKRHPLIAELTRHPWAIAESYLPLVASVLTRIACGDPISEVDRARIHSRRAEFLRAHPPLTPAAMDDYDDRLPPEPYAKVSNSAAGGTVVAVIGVYGVLTQRGGIDMDTSEPLTSMAWLSQSVRLAAADPTIGAIVLDVDSPGGSVYGVAELADAIFAARDSKPIAAVCNSLMASAAFWAASQADSVYCTAGGEVGSIGVYTLHTNFAELLKQRGVAIELISAGKFKTEGNPYGPLTDEARAHVQASVDQYYDAFVRAVARGRGSPLKNVREGMGQGRVLQAEQAKAENMIDGIATLGQVISKMGERSKRASARAAMQRETDIASLG